MMETLETSIGAVLFTDLVGFTEFNDVAGDQAAVAALDAQLDLTRGTLEAHPEARVVKELGDGLMIWLGDARPALGVASALLASFERARDTGTFPLPVRMGIHHGEVVRRGDDLVGQTVNIAARVADLAGPGELLATEAITDCSSPTPAGIELLPVGPASVKGVSDPIWLHLVTPL
ncbi:MAG: adenylate/guanylate cyclase domain-containing protein [Actinomycetia bacterium]|nr:adenylate/guanylate cyclase domain-containing protein [Actinomycetes bacterium]MCP4959766.1 adenylate/guanylate cyclase domain-containing protein [Actinomycetes bacterium]